MDASDVTLAHLEAETDRVVATAVSFRNDAVLAPSLCDGWSRGHVLSHLARNAEALQRVCAAALSGSGDTMYDSNETRDAEILEGARRSARDLAEDVRDTAARLAPAIARMGPEHAGLTVERTPGGGLVPVGLVPYLRLRELVLHHVDLDAGFGFGHLSPEIATLLLAETVARLRDSADVPGLQLGTHEGDTYVVGDGAASVSGSRAGMLLWLTRGIGRDVESDGPLPTLPSGG